MTTGKAAHASRDTHPVWTVYDKLRSARLNVKYYGRRLQSKERLNFAMEFILLATAPTSAIAGLLFWQDPLGKLIWQYFGAVAGLAAVIKPILGLPKHIKEYEGVTAGYRILEYDLMQIKVLIEQRKKFDAPLQAEMRKLSERERALVVKAPESTEDKKLLIVCEEEVLQELPREAFFVPED